jgi:hypothetical protein
MIVEGYNDEAWELDRALPDGWYVVAPSRSTAYAYPVDPRGHDVPVRAAGVGVELSGEYYGTNNWYVSKSFTDDDRVKTAHVGTYGSIREAARAAARAV